MERGTVRRVSLEELRVSVAKSRYDLVAKKREKAA
jgi:hypothetical protein